LATAGAITGASSSVTGIVTGASVVGGVITGTTVSTTGTVTGGNLATAGAITGASSSVTGIVTGASVVGGVITGSSISVSGAVTGATGVSTPSITHTGTTNVGDIGQSGHVFATVYATTFSGVSTSAKYADLAEKYTADADYAAGTVVMFGGDSEVTIANEDSTTRIAGVISAKPAVIMNQGLESEFVAVVALQGRVPCRVIGTVAKGDLMVATSNGAAKADNLARAGTIIGKALENFDGAEGTIEVVVGRN
jgi:hypothetical protein